jgi:hypothetical protein
MPSLALCGVDCGSLAFDVCGLVNEHDATIPAHNEDGGKTEIPPHPMVLRGPTVVVGDILSTC